MEKLNKGIIAIGGPSGAGKSSIIRRLIKNFPNLFELSVSMTTRSKRPDEVHGIHYFFVTEQEFRIADLNRKFLERVDTESSQTGKYYATLLSEIERIDSSNKFIILDVDLEGIFSVKERYFHQSLSFYVYNNLTERNRLLVERQKGTITDVADLNTRLNRGEIQDNLAFKSDKYKSVIDHFVENHEGKIEETYKKILREIFKSRLFEPKKIGQEYSSLKGI